MDAEQFQEKMDPLHRQSLCRMLGVKELPGNVLEMYAEVKGMVDRIDAHLTHGDLAMIIVIASSLLGETTEGEDARLQTQADELAAKPSLDEAEKKIAEEKAASVEAPAMTGAEAEAAIASGAAKPVEPLERVAAEKGLETIAAQDVAEDKEVENVLEPPVGESVEQPDRGKDILWFRGMPVNVLQEDELKQGKIVGILDPQPDIEGTVQLLTIEFEGGETVTIDESEVEAV